MIFTQFTGRPAVALRLIGLALVSWSVLRASHHAPTGSGRGLVISVMFGLCLVAWLTWMRRPVPDRGITPEIWVLAAAGGVLCGASPNSAASAFVFVAVVAAGVRAELSRAFIVVGVGILALAASVLVYNGSALGLLAYSLGFAAATLAGANARQAAARAEQAELLLAQTQRSHEEQLRAARLEESTRIAREIHDVLAHALAGLTIQLEATSALVDQGADPATIRARLDRAHALAREGLRETRRAVGALRSEPIAAEAGIEALVDEYRGGDGAAELTIDGDPGRVAGPVAEAVLRVVQEALTNVRKHAPGASVSVALHAGDLADRDVVLVVDDQPDPTARAPSPLAAAGGGYGVQGMRERAQALGGTLTAGPLGDGWRVELRVPVPAGSAGPAPEAPCVPRTRSGGSGRD
ncbi:MAG TPA: histidine kinase [Solirubrobacteraceae bacterium]